MRLSSMSGWLKRTESSSSCWRCLCIIIDHHQYLLNRHQVFQSMVIKVVGNYIHLGSVLVFVDKQEHADGLLKVFQRILPLFRIFHVNLSNRIFHCQPSSEKILCKIFSSGLDECGLLLLRLSPRWH